MKKRLVGLILSSVVCFSIGFGLVAQGEGLPEVGIIEYKQEGNEAGVLYDTISPVGQGEILTKESTLRSAPLPEKYDPRGGPLDTGVRDQGQLGLCWAYTGTDLISIAARKQLNQTKRYSPNYFNYLSAGNAFSSTEINPRSEMSVGLNGLKSWRKIDIDGNSSDYVALISMLEERNVLDTTLGTPKELSVNLPIDTNQFSHFQWTLQSILIVFQDFQK